MPQTKPKPESEPDSSGSQTSENDTPADIRHETPQEAYLAMLRDLPDSIERSDAGRFGDTVNHDRFMGIVGPIMRRHGFDTSISEVLSEDMLWEIKWGQGTAPVRREVHECCLTWAGEEYGKTDRFSHYITCEGPAEFFSGKAHTYVEKYWLARKFGINLGESQFDPDMDRSKPPTYTGEWVQDADTLTWSVDGEAEWGGTLDAQKRLYKLLFDVIKGAAEDQNLAIATYEANIANIDALPAAGQDVLKKYHSERVAAVNQAVADATAAETADGAVPSDEAIAEQAQQSMIEES